MCFNDSSEPHGCYGIHCCGVQMLVSPGYEWKGPFRKKRHLPEVARVYFHRTLYTVPSAEALRTYHVSGSNAIIIVKQLHFQKVILLLD